MQIYDQDVRQVTVDVTRRRLQVYRLRDDRDSVFGVEQPPEIATHGVVIIGQYDPDRVSNRDLVEVKRGGRKAKGWLHSTTLVWGALGAIRMNLQSRCGKVPASAAQAQRSPRSVTLVRAARPWWQAAGASVKSLQHDATKRRSPIGATATAEIRQPMWLNTGSSARLQAVAAAVA